MIREIVTDDEILSKPCDEGTAEDAAIVEDLIDTLKSLETAAGLAANQIGETKRIVVYLDMKDNPHAMFNPVIKMALNPSTVAEECLSHEGQYVTVKRFAKINVAYQELINGQLVDRKRKFEGWTAQVIQHLVDHCNGKLV
ncbi:peptide deformylase [Slackia heliotrinireducens]|jgi:peptide deformylase|uniref:N-formylmethionyl-tRNA deformylase n=1 Tax=Slackia heliotrinireducens (strain ATCC 29202 / DSM 20476 / NCTC 11029 / RHS 1) TaxID=471855 RepID=C7N3X5_SLAHD|nr:peptide deformylase [Slackia heliotrinireducens]ACV21716.1 N-formylmethionyl-tRNA deformylase [Slackia heliotrinireducens DSM 20476]VEG99356.1 Peptide deformylase [Slackia heliotrinireducens]